MYGGGGGVGVCKRTAGDLWGHARLVVAPRISTNGLPRTTSMMRRSIPLSHNPCKLQVVQVGSSPTSGAAVVGGTGIVFILVVFH